MYYPGSKERIAGAILFYVLKNRDDRPYVEPFMGGANVICNVSGERYGNDINPYLISMWKALQEGWTPPEFVDKETYKHMMRNQGLYDPHLVGYTGFVCSFNSNWFKGHRGIVERVRTGKDGKPVLENQQEWARNNLMRQVSSMIGVHLSHSSYEELPIPKNSIVLCDPPYAEVTKDYITRQFDTISFWEWVRDMKSSAMIFVTEYVAPDDFTCVWEENINPVGGTLHGSRQPNKLFVHESQLHMVDTTPPSLPKLRIPS